MGGWRMEKLKIDKDVAKALMQEAIAPVKSPLHLCAIHGALLSAKELLSNRSETTMERFLIQVDSESGDRILGGERRLWTLIAAFSRRLRVQRKDRDGRTAWTIAKT